MKSSAIRDELILIRVRFLSVLYLIFSFREDIKPCILILVPLHSEAKSNQLIDPGWHCHPFRLQLIAPMSHHKCVEMKPLQRRPRTQYSVQKVIPFSNIFRICHGLTRQILHILAMCMKYETHKYNEYIVQMCQDRHGPKSAHHI